MCIPEENISSPPDIVKIVPILAGSLQVLLQTIKFNPWNGSNKSL